MMEDPHAAFVMPLERRVLFAVVGPTLNADLQQTAQDGSTIVGDVSQCIFQPRIDTQVLAADLRGEVHTAAERKELAAALAAGRQFSASLRSGYFRIIRAGLTDGHAAATYASQFVNGKLHSFSPDRLLNELTRLQQKTATPLADFVAAVPGLSTSFSNALIPLAAAFPDNATLQADTQTANSNASSCVTTIQSDATLAQNDLNTLIGDLTG